MSAAPGGELPPQRIRHVPGKSRLLPQVNAIVAMLVLAALAPAAEDSAPGYAHETQHAALNELVGSLGGQKLPAELLLKLSRMLSDPQDQLRWLGEKLDSGVPADRNAFAQAIEARQQTLLKWDANLERSPEYEALAAKVRSVLMVKPWEIDEPLRLIEIMRSGPDLSGASADQKFKLLSRGVPDSLVKLGAPWNQPGAAVFKVAEKPMLPPVAEVLAGLAELQAGRGKLPADAAGVKMAFDVAGALLERATGDDHGGGQPSPAAELEKLGLWTWAALAYVLEGANAADLGARQAAAEKARALWAQSSDVATGLGLPLRWAGVDDWIARLTGAPAAESIELLPLSPNVAELRRRRRVEMESGIPSAAADGNALFLLIQQIKAAELGVANAQAFTIEDFRKQLGEGQQILYLYLETLAVRAGQTSEFYAVALSARDYNAAAADVYVARALGPKGSLTALVDAALQGLNPTDEAKIIIALDGPPGDEWFADGERRLLERISVVKARDRKAWLAYTPTALVWRKDAWTLDATLRLWMPLARAAGGLDVARPHRDYVSSLGERWRQAGLSLSSTSLGPHPTDLKPRTPQEYNAALRQLKERGPARVLPLLVAPTRG